MEIGFPEDVQARKAASTRSAPAHAGDLMPAAFILLERWGGKSLPALRRAATKSRVSNTSSEGNGLPRKGGRGKEKRGLLGDGGEPSLTDQT